MYFNAGVPHKIMEGLNVGLDAFYKSSNSTIDEGKFGAALIKSSFNYKRGRIYGGEFTNNYDPGPFSAYGNLAWGWGRGTHWSSSQFLFSPGDYAFVKKHWIFFDHGHRATASTGASYPWHHCDR